MHLLLYSESSADSGTRANWRWLVWVLVAGVTVIVIVRTIFFVDESQYVYVTQFGQPIRFISRPGLQAKWPYQSVRRFDRRLQVFEPPAREMLTQDKENLNFAWYVCWRLPGRDFAEQPSGISDASRAEQSVEEHVRRFMQSAGTIPVMENRLEERVQALLAAEIGRLRFEQLVSLDREQLQLAQLAARVTRELRQSAAEQFGVEVVDVRVKRINYPDAVKPAVFAEIRSERERVAVQYRAEGASEKAKIQSLADLQRDQLLAEAKREALAIRGGGEAMAIDIFNQAHSKDPQFYELLKTLETYRSILDNQTTVVLSADTPLLKLLTHGLPEPAPLPKNIPSEGAPPITTPNRTATTSSKPTAAPQPTEGNR